jgi:hypothetical protein
MATASLHQSQASQEHIQRFEGKVRAMKTALAAVPGDGFHEKLITVIHRPGWTTIAEGQFFEAALDSILAQTQQLAQLHQQLMAAADSVGRS